MSTECRNGRIDNTHVASIEPLQPPIKLKGEIVNRSVDLIAKTRHEIQDILHGQDPNRLLIVVGPCSIHDTQAAYEYAERLGNLKDDLSDELLIAMRTYPEKPRTTVGWTGFVYDPNLDGSSDASTGLRVSRRLLADINSLGLPCAVEFLDPITPQYLADLISWAAIGARTTESQIHRQLASGLSMPIGFKNATDGNSKVAIDAIVAAASPHTFFGIDTNGQASIVRTSGNPDTHLVLRGGNKGPNYDEASINQAVNQLQERGLLTQSSHPIMIDCSHGNSGKDHKRQSVVIENVLQQIQSGQCRVMGFMLESNLHEGRQDWIAGKPLEYGVSITDACIGWRETERVLLECARAVRPKIFALT